MATKDYTGTVKPVSPSMQDIANMIGKVHAELADMGPIPEASDLARAIWISSLSVAGASGAKISPAIRVKAATAAAELLESLAREFRALAESAQGEN